jgi:hypothetical protein
MTFRKNKTKTKNKQKGRTYFSLYEKKHGAACIEDDASHYPASPPYVVLSGKTALYIYVQEGDGSRPHKQARYDIVVMNEGSESQTVIMKGVACKPECTVR